MIYAWCKLIVIQNWQIENVPDELLCSLVCLMG